jgi:predicted RNA-binding Zn-ribbon protein involved in translation (DUF1610 family)
MLLIEEREEKKILLNNKESFNNEDASQNIDASSFSFYSIISNILNKKFKADNLFQKRKVIEKEEYFRFACPVCGDSKKELNKKRGYLFKNNLHYKCFNCGASKNFLTFIHDMGITLNIEKEEEFLDRLKVIKTSYTHSLNENNNGISNVHELSLLLSEIDNFQNFPDLKNFIQYFKLIEPIGNYAEIYLNSRFQNNSKNNLYYSLKNNSIYILNIVQNKVLGFQIRNLNPNAIPKYHTYKASKIFNEYPNLFFNKQDITLNDISKFDRLSLLFGINEINIQESITIFEGPFDSFLFPNSVGICSAMNDFHIECENKRYFFDYDKTGRDNMQKKLNKGNTVFLWSKFLQDMNLSDKKKWDLTDIIVYCKNNNKKILDFNNYFSDSIYDTIWI